MFGQKQKKIEELEFRVSNDQAAFNTIFDENARKATVIRELNEGVLKLVNQNRDCESRIETLDYALSESKELNRALEEENKDLIRQVELYRATLASVRINVSLPARKK
jgi:hypothetical protein